ATAAYDVKGSMTTPAGPRGAEPARDRSPARAGRHRLRTVLTVIVAVCAAAVAGGAGFSLLRSAGSSQSIPHPPPAGPAAARGSPGSGSAAVKPANSSKPARPALSPAQLAGQRVIYSYGGLIPPTRLLRWIRAGQVAGVIFFGGNIASPAQLGGVVAELDRA